MFVDGAEVLDRTKEGLGGAQVRLVVPKSFDDRLEDVRLPP